MSQPWVNHESSQFFLFCPEKSILNLLFWACTRTLYELVTEEFNYVVSRTEVQSLWVLSTIRAKRGTNWHSTRKFVMITHCTQYKIHFCNTSMPKIHTKAFKFHLMCLASDQSPAPNNAIKCQNNRLSHWSVQIIPIFIVLCSLGKIRLSGCVFTGTILAR